MTLERGKLVRTPEEFAQWVERSGLTKDQLAKVLGITRQTLHNWTNARLKAESELTGKKLIAGSTEYARLPMMLSLSIYAIDHMPKEVALQELGQSVLINKS